MGREKGEVLLTTGELMKICIVKAPAAHLTESIMSFLPRYTKIWRWHLNMCLRGELDELESRFYLGFLEDKIISNVSTWEHGPIGIVGHLFTVEDQRRKGACTALMKAQIQDFLRRRGKILIGGFKPSSYPVAKDAGFESITSMSEVMRYDVALGFEKEYFQAKKTLCRDSMWKDWPGISLLYTTQNGWHLRSVKHGIVGPFDYEDYFLEDMKQRLKGLCVTKVLVTEKEHIVGHAVLTLNRRSDGNYWLFDLFVHPASISHADAMLKAISWPKGTIRSYAEADCHEKYHALLAHGFSKKAILQKQIGGKTSRIAVMER